jgi:hypothetical protein
MDEEQFCRFLPATSTHRYALTSNLFPALAQKVRITSLFNVRDRADNPLPPGYPERMPLYFFNFSRSPKAAARPFKNEGLELLDDDAAWEEATTACGEKLREMNGSLRPGDGWKMEVTDAGGKALFALKFTTESSE